MSPVPLHKSAALYLAPFLGISGHAFPRRQYISRDSGSNPYDSAPLGRVNDGNSTSTKFPSGAWAGVVLAICIVIIFFSACYWYGKQSQRRAFQTLGITRRQKQSRPSLDEGVVGPPPTYEAASALKTMKPAHIAKGRSELREFGEPFD